MLIIGVIVFEQGKFFLKDEEDNYYSIHPYTDVEKYKLNKNHKNVRAEGQCFVYSSSEYRKALGYSGYVYPGRFKPILNE